MENNKNGFDKNLKKGEAHEAKFYTYLKTKYPNRDVKWLKTNFEADFMIDDFKLELKTDFTRHSNFFMEYYSNIETKRMGGVWQAAGYKARYYAIWYVDPSNAHQWSCYCFETKPLLEWLEAHKDEYPTGKVKNEGYTTLGFVIPMHRLTGQSFCRCSKIEVK
jgi:hypothetical protein